MNAELLLTQFAAVARFCEKSLSEDTKRTYRRITAQFFRFVGPIGSPGEVTTEVVLSWRESMIRDRASNDTIRLKLSVVRSLFDYLKVAGLVAHNPADVKLVGAPPQSDELAGRALTTDEVRLLLSVPDTGTHTGARDYAILLVGLRMFLREHEIAGLPMSGFSLDQGRPIVRVKVKGGRTRTVPVPGEVATAIGTYLALAGKLPDDRVFPITVRTVWNIVVRNAKQAGIGHVSPHDLRRTATTRAYELGYTDNAIQLAGGWKDPKTPRRYKHSRNNLEQNAINTLNYGGTN